MNIDLHGSRLVSAIVSVLLVAVRGTATGQAERHDIPQFAFQLDTKSTLLRWKPLHQTVLPRGAIEELRVWVGFGIESPEYVVRIVPQPNRVIGARVFYWMTGTDPDKETEAERDSTMISDHELQQNLQRLFGCTRPTRRADYTVCEVTRPARDTWANILRRLDSLGIAQLPDARERSPPGPSGLDGTTMVVELRTKLGYRTYSYWTPSSQAPQPEVRRAAAIMELLDRIGSRPP